VGFIFREEVYKPDDPDLEGKAELIIAKQRNGPTGIVRMAFIKNSTRFVDATNEEPPGY
jgi:replicative DNA helicase